MRKLSISTPPPFRATFQVTDHEHFLHNCLRHCSNVHGKFRYHCSEADKIALFFRNSFLLFSLSAIWILDDSSAVGAGKLVLAHYRWETKYRFWSAGPSLKFSKDIVINSPVFFPYEDRTLVDQLRLTHFPSHHTVCTFVFNNAFHCAAQPADSLQQELTFYEVKRSTSVQFDEIPCWVHHTYSNYSGSIIR